MIILDEMCSAAYQIAHRTTPSMSSEVGWNHRGDSRLGTRENS